MLVALQIVRIIAVIALVCGAGAMVTPKGRIPLAFRGVAKLFKISAEEQKVPGWKKLVAFLLVLGAIIIAAI